MGKNLNKLKKAHKKKWAKVMNEIKGECSVCYNNCERFTNCNHLLCNKCEKKLHEKICPICRKDLNDYKNKLTEKDKDLKEI